MKFEMAKEDLVKVLSSIQSVAERKGPPILSHVLMEASSTGVRFVATDFDMTLQIVKSARVYEEGKTTAPAKSLLDIVKEFPKNDIILTFQPLNMLEIVSDKAVFQLPCLDPLDFPIDQLEEDVSYTACNGKLLKQIFAKTLYAIPLSPTSSSKPGLYIFRDSESTKIYRFFSFDSFRASIMEMTQDDLGMDLPINEAVVPRKGVQELIKLLEEEGDSGNIFLGFSDNLFYTKTNSTLISVRLLDASFPSFDEIIPKTRGNVVSIPLNEFQQVLRRMSIFTNQSWRHVKLTFRKDILEVSAGNPEIGLGMEKLEVDYKGYVFNISLNIKYLSEAINVVTAENFNFEWDDSFEGVFITDPEDAGYLALIMPIVSD